MNKHSAVSIQLSAISYQLSAISYQLSVYGHAMRLLNKISTSSSVSQKLTVDG
ncbi:MULTISPECIES: hypothetical protein [unclassified Moorena]|uniref:hypothetical protein n=1 Tax=unclassified Moorena TaxID=2683338 RepID=UPI0025EDFAFE|nr:MULTISPECIES: hypothetical protein [unclassified Moorena]